MVFDPHVYIILITFLLRCKDGHTEIKSVECILLYAPIC